MFESRIFAGATEKHLGVRNFTQKQSLGLMTWKVMRKSAWKYFVIWPTKKTVQLYQVSTPCLDDRNFKEEELGSVG